MTTIQESKIRTVTNYLKIEPRIIEDGVNAYTVIYVKDEVNSHNCEHLIKFGLTFRIEPLDQERFKIVIVL
jgi:hypothetical protein